MNWERNGEGCRHTRRERARTWTQCKTDRRAHPRHTRPARCMQTHQPCRDGEGVRGAAATGESPRAWLHAAASEAASSRASARLAQRQEEVAQPSRV